MEATSRQGTTIAIGHFESSQKQWLSQEQSLRICKWLYSSKWKSVSKTLPITKIGSVARCSFL